VVIWLTGEPLVPMKYPTLKEIIANQSTFPSLSRKIKVATAMLNSSASRRVGPVSVAPSASERTSNPEMYDPEWLDFVASLPQGLYQEKTFFEWTVTMEGNKYIHHRIERRALTCLDVEELLALQDLSRTELCHFWEKDGICPYEDDCRFSHGIHELRPVIRHPKYKSSVCNQYGEGGRCQYGIRCRFVHSASAAALDGSMVITEDIAKPIPHYSPPAPTTVLTEADAALLAIREAAQAAAKASAEAMVRSRMGKKALTVTRPPAPALTSSVLTPVKFSPPPPPTLTKPLYESDAPAPPNTPVPEHAVSESPGKNLWSMPRVALAPWEAPSSPQITQSRLFSMFSAGSPTPRPVSARTSENDQNMDNSMMDMLGMAPRPIGLSKSASPKPTVRTPTAPAQGSACLLSPSTRS